MGELQTNMTVDGFSSWEKKGKISHTSSDDDRSFIGFVTTKRSRFANDDDPRQQFPLRLLPHLRVMNLQSIETI
jgi:hypothetical protein